MLSHNHYWDEEAASSGASWGTITSGLELSSYKLVTLFLTSSLLLMSVTMTYSGKASTSTSFPESASLLFFSFVSSKGAGEPMNLGELVPSVSSFTGPIALSY